MNRAFISTVLLMVLALAGCRQGPEQRALIDQYNNEQRRLEDIIYELEYDKEVLCSENERLKQRLAKVEDGSALKSDTPTRLFNPRPTAPTSNKPSDEPEFTPPTIEMGPKIKPTGPRLSPPAASKKPEVPPIELEEAAPPTDDAPSIEPLDDPPHAIPAKPVSESPLPTPPASIRHSPPSLDTLPTPRSEPTRSPKLPELLPVPENKKVSDLYIDPSRTRGDDRGLELVVQPRNAQGQFVPIAGRISVVVIDPSRPGESGRIGRWEFDSDYVRYQMRASGKQNIPLTAPWTNGRPSRSPLKLFVRLECEDGQKFESNSNIELPATGQVSSQWMPRAPQRRGPIAKDSGIAVGPIPPRVVAPATHVAPQTSEVEVEVASEVSEPEWKPFR